MIAVDMLLDRRIKKQIGEFEFFSTVANEIRPSWEQNKPFPHMISGPFSFTFVSTVLFFTCFTEELYNVSRHHQGRTSKRC